MFLKTIFTKTLNARHEKFIKGRKWFFYSWELILIIGVALFAALLSVIPNWTEPGKTISFPDGHGGTDVYTPNELRDNIIYSSISVAVAILAAVFIGVQTELGQYIGKYSSSLFVLVPSLVWLLSDRSDDHISRIAETEELLSNAVFYLTLTCGALFMISSLVKKVFVSFAWSLESRRVVELTANFINRLNIVIINIAMLILLSYSLINFGIFSLHLADIPISERNEIARTTGETAGIYNLHSEPFTTYIGMTALLFAVLMVAIGMSNMLISKDKADDIEMRLDSGMAVEINESLDDKRVRVAIDYAEEEKLIEREERFEKIIERQEERRKHEK